MSPPSPSSSSSNGFFAICLLHSAIATSCGALMMLYLDELSALGHGAETAGKLRGSTPHDQLLIQVSDSFAGLLLFVVGALLFMVAFVRDRDFQVFFAKGCVLLHAAVALWRVLVERGLEDLASDWPRQLVGDFVLSMSWVLFLVYTWNEKYD
ncbi:putative proline-rich receptor-like protein kinase PERK13 [Iris pallida]|uniref:Proline-rich receptor-like protein kinase PERK13 n=1 Tax=Iris pallida TaxID=29817 RepID=A0AAX6EZG2_IRIPA|nr:putative proline-rich receptor-like protein kinase PERK13 [Iris pallida]